MKWLPGRHAPTPRSDEDARAALAQSVDELLGGVQMRQQARIEAERLRNVDRRNHLRESVLYAFREAR